MELVGFGFSRILAWHWFFRGTGSRRREDVDPDGAKIDIAMGVYNDVAPDGAGRGLAMHIGFTWFDPNPGWQPNSGVALG